MKRVDAEFKDRVYALVARIPEGRLMTYGQVAACCGAAWAAWEVGQIAHLAPCNCGNSCWPGAGEAGNSANKQAQAICPAGLPWQRVVNKQGGLARGYTWGGFDGHKHALEAENITVSDDFKVDIDKLLWRPEIN